MVVSKIEKTEEPGAVVVVFVVQRVTDRGNTTDRVAIAEGEEGCEFAAGGEEGRARSEGVDNAPRDGRDELREAT